MDGHKAVASGANLCKDLGGRQFAHAGRLLTFRVVVFISPCPCDILVWHAKAAAATPLTYLESVGPLR